MGSFLRRLLYAATLSGVCFLQACAALPPLPQRTESRALPGGTPSAFARKVAAERGNASAAQSGLISISTCLTKVLPWNCGGRG